MKSKETANPRFIVMKERIAQCITMAHWSVLIYTIHYGGVWLREISIMLYNSFCTNILVYVFQLSRNQRFSASFHHTVETLVNMMMPHITQKYKDNLDAARNANHSLAVFIKVRIHSYCFCMFLNIYKGNARESCTLHPVLVCVNNDFLFHC